MGIQYKKTILIVLLITAKGLFSCECPPLAPVTKEIYSNYDVLFFGHVDSIAMCDSQGNSFVYFTIDELYKGNVAQHLKVSFDCSSECLMSFTAGEKWLMYTNYKRFDLLTVTICSHSRKFFDDESKDFYLLTAQRTFNQEKEFLKTTLGIQPFAQSNEQYMQATSITRNEQPSSINKLLLLTISFAVMAIIYFIFKRKNGK